jgi:hypothetical protein
VAILVARQGCLLREIPVDRSVVELGQSQDGGDLFLAADYLRAAVDYLRAADYCYHLLACYYS